MSWVNRFIGIPFREFGRDRAGCDCWGLACIVYREELGIWLPDYLGYGSVEEHAEIAALVAGAAASPLWQPVPRPSLPEAFDIAVFRRGRLSTHVGLVIRPGILLHVEGEDCAKVARYDRGPMALRLAGHYRHQAMALRGKA